MVEVEDILVKSGHARRSLSPRGTQPRSLSPSVGRCQYRAEVLHEPRGELVN